MSSQPITRAEAIALSVAACFNSTKSWLSNAAVRIGKGTKEAFEFLGNFFSTLGSDFKSNFSKVLASFRQWIHANPRGSAAVAGAFVGAAIVLLIIGVVTLVKWFFSGSSSQTNPAPSSTGNAGSGTGVSDVDPTPDDEVGGSSNAGNSDQLPPDHAVDELQDSTLGSGDAASGADPTGDPQPTGTENSAT